jgi:predicted RNA methylase
MRRLPRQAADVLTAVPGFLKAGGVFVRRIRRDVRVWRFNRRHGLDTGGRQRLSHAVRAAARHGDGVDFEATSPGEWRRAIRALPITDPGAFTFLDLGCGKGLTLILARMEGFGRIIGVELDPSVAAAARGNVARWRSGDAIEVVEADAVGFPLPAEPCVLYLYNPFGSQTMEAVARAVETSLDRRPRPLFVVYVNPVHQGVWDGIAALRPVRRTRRWVVYQFTDGQTEAIHRVS